MVRRALILIPLLALFLATPVQAITYGTPDNDQHPNVGLLLINGSPICTGTYIGPQQGSGKGLFLTAAHCLDTASQAVTVSFATQYTAGSATYTGTAYANPNYTKSQNNPGDMAVVVLDSDPGARGILKAELPATGLLDQLDNSRELRKTTFTAVGYGECGPSDCADPTADIRRLAHSRYTTINKAWLKLSQNNSQGYGGTCYGDSGGPNFFETSGLTTTIAALTVTGDSMCKSTNVAYRLDTQEAHAFIDPFFTTSPQAAASSVKESRDRPNKAKHDSKHGNNKHHQ